MIGCRVETADTVVAFRKTTLNFSTQTALAISVVIDALEEIEGISLRGGVLVLDLLNSNMSMANDIAVLQLLGRGVISVIRIGEASSIEVCNLDSDCERLIGLDHVIILRAGEDGANHIALPGDFAHDYEVLACGC